MWYNRGEVKTMQFQIDHDLHVHSVLSTCCADERQTPEFILAHAVREGLSTVCLTNHFWDETVPGENDWYRVQNYAHISRALPLPQREGVRFLFGCETELDRHLTLGLARENAWKFDFIVIPVTHFHKVGFTLREEEALSAETRALAWVRRVSAVLEMDLPFEKVGLAHLACPLIARHSRTEYLRSLSLIPQSALFDIFRTAARLGLGIELNARDFDYAPHEAETVLRMFYTAHECSCKFYLASDAHSPEATVAAKESFLRAVSALDLQEEDKFLLNPRP